MRFQTHLFPIYIFLGNLYIHATCQSNNVEGSSYWQSLGAIEIEKTLKLERNMNTAKNLIIFVGDGMGMTTITAGRIYKGQLEGKSGEEGYLTFEKFPDVGLVKTYNVDKQVPDSAGTATALFSGIKGNYYQVGFDAQVNTSDCKSGTEEAKVKTIIDWGVEAKKSTGIVTTTRISHATPAATYAHSPHRDWECDTKIPESERDCKDISRQLFENEPGMSLNVIFGGGEQTLNFNVNSTDTCKRGDRRNLIETWKNTHFEKKHKFRHVSNKKELANVDPNESDFVLGIFSPNHLPYDKERNPAEDGEPSLEEMTVKAIKILQKNKNGFILMVEGGRIDHAHHDNLAKIALEEVVAFDKAIESALKLTNTEDTLIIVTADHSHSLTLNGYPKRGNPIGGVGDVAKDGFAYQTLTYANGPSYYQFRLNETNLVSTDPISTWINLNFTDFNDRRKPHLAAIWDDDETHGGEDVPVYAFGPFSFLLNGVHEQTHVPWSIAYSMCIGPYYGNCRDDSNEINNIVNNSQNKIEIPAFLILFLSSFLVLKSFLYQIKS